MSGTLQDQADDDQQEAGSGGIGQEAPDEAAFWRFERSRQGRAEEGWRGNGMLPESPEAGGVLFAVRVELRAQAIRYLRGRGNFMILQMSPYVGPIVH